MKINYYYILQSINPIHGHFTTCVTDFLNYKFCGVKFYIQQLIFPLSAHDDTWLFLPPIVLNFINHHILFINNRAEINNERQDMNALTSIFMCSIIQIICVTIQNQMSIVVGKAGEAKRPVLRALVSLMYSIINLSVSRSFPLKQPYWVVNKSISGPINPFTLPYIYFLSLSLSPDRSIQQAPWL